MSDTAGAVLTRHPWVARRPLTVTDYHRMGDAGILGAGDRVELIEGELVQMTPIGTDHFGAVNKLLYILGRAVGDQALVTVQNPVRLNHLSEPQPDCMLLRPRPDFYRRKFPEPADVLLLVEVAHSSVAYDRSVKLPLYGRDGIAEYWLVRLDTGVVEVYREPNAEGFGSMRSVRIGAALDIAALPGITVAASDVLD